MNSNYGKLWLLASVVACVGVACGAESGKPSLTSLDTVRGRIENVDNDLHEFTVVGDESASEKIVYDASTRFFVSDSGVSVSEFADGQTAEVIYEERIGNPLPDQHGFAPVWNAAVLVRIDSLVGRPHPPRFVDNGDGTVSDRERKQMWQKAQAPSELTWQEAKQYCRQLNLGGHTDWRLLSVDDYSEAIVVQLMSDLISQGGMADFFWSSDSTCVLPFNYPVTNYDLFPAVCEFKETNRAFVRAIRDIGTAVKPDTSAPANRQPSQGRNK